MSNYKQYAETEFKAAGWDLENDEMQALICKQVLDLLELFSTQGHSGSSAAYAINLFSKLAAFEPLTPLTGEDWEWNECGNGVFQNKRCSHVFKQPDRFNGQAYDAKGKIFEDETGATWTSSESAVPIVFPYIPKREYVLIRDKND